MGSLFWLVWGTTLGMGLGTGGLVVGAWMLHRQDPGLPVSPEPDNSKKRPGPAGEAPPLWWEREPASRSPYPAAWDEAPPAPVRRTQGGADTMDVLNDGYEAAHAAQGREPAFGSERRAGQETSHNPPYYPAPPAGQWMGRHGAPQTMAANGGGW